MIFVIVNIKEKKILLHYCVLREIEFSLNITYKYFHSCKTFSFENISIFKPPVHNNNNNYYYYRRIRTTHRIDFTSFDIFVFLVHVLKYYIVTTLYICIHNIIQQRERCLFNYFIPTPSACLYICRGFHLRAIFYLSSLRRLRGHNVMRALLRAVNCVYIRMYIYIYIHKL